MFVNAVQDLYIEKSIMVLILYIQERCMSSILSGNLPQKYYFAVVLLFFEACYILFWTISMFYLVFAIETDGGEKYRLFHGILGVHLVIAPTGIFYVVENHRKNPYTFVLWLFLAIFVFDLFAVLEVYIHLKRTIYDFWVIEAISATWSGSLSLLAVFWYMYILWTRKKVLISSAFPN